MNTQASHTTMDSNKSTAQFEIPHLSLEHGGVWECRVATNGGQDSRKFNLTVKGKVTRILFFSNVLLHDHHSSFGLVDPQ